MSAPETESSSGTITIHTDAVEDIRTNAGTILVRLADAAENAKATLDAIEALTGSVPAKVRSGSLISAIAKAKADLMLTDYLSGKISLDMLLNNLVEEAVACDDEAAEYFNSILESIAVLGLEETELTNLINYRTNAADFTAYTEYVQQIWGKYANTEGKGNEEDIREQFIQSLKAHGYSAAYLYSPDPVNLSNGNFIYERTDLYIHAKTDLVFKRTYNAQRTEKGLFGQGWSTILEERIKKEKEAILLYRADGAREPFVKEESGEKYRSLLDANREIIPLPEGNILLDDTTKTTKLFDQTGNLISIHGINGGTVVLQRKDGKVTTLLSDTKEAIHIRYENGKIAGLTDHGGRNVTYRYDEKGNLTDFTGTDGATYQYTYDETGRMCAITNPEEIQTVENDYDEHDRVTFQRFADGGSNTFVYEGNTVRFTERDGSTASYIHDTKQRNIRTEDETGKTRRVYHATGNISKETDRRGNSTTYIYDNSGRIIGKKDRMAAKTTYCYDEEGNLIKTTQPDGVTERRTYDETGNLTEIHLGEELLYRLIYNEKEEITAIGFSDHSCIHIGRDEKGNLTEITGKAGEETYSCAEYRYDIYNRLQTITDGNGNRTCYTYDAKDRILEIINPEGNSRSFTYHSNGKPLTITDFDKAEESYTYDRAGRVSSHTGKNGYRTEYTYDYMGRCTAIHHPDGTQTGYTYDFLGNITTIIDEEGNQTTFSYDANGNCTTVTKPNGAQTTYTYDKENRILAVTYPDGSVLSYTYNPAGRILTIDTPDYAHISYNYDNSGRIIYAEDGKGNRETYTYHMGKLIAEVRRNEEKLLTNTYGPGGRLMKRTYGNGYEETYDYDLCGNLIRTRDNRGTEMLITYDCMNRPVKMSDNTGKEETATYDACGRLLTLKRNGTTISRYTYDKEGNLLMATDAAGMRTAYRYNQKGKLEYMLQRAEKDPFGEVMDDEDWLEAIRMSRQNQNLHLTTFERNKTGEITAVTDALLHTQPFAADRTDISSILEKNLKKTKQQTTGEGEKETIQETLRSILQYHYDETGRISDIQMPGNIRALFTYESPVERSLSYYHGEELLDRFHYTYGTDGYLQKAELYRKDLPEADGTYCYGHDAAGRLLSVTKDDTICNTYTYDIFGNRVAETENGITKTYTYDVTNRMLNQVEEQIHQPVERNPQTARGMGTYIRTPFAILQQTGAGEAGNLILLDPLGSAVRTLDREGNTLEAMAYDPYGKEMAYMQITAGALYHSPFGYGGYYRTERKHVYQTENRVYNGNTGRFESKDSELFVHPYVPESTNLYQYAWNSPLRYTDPTGRDVEESEWDRYMELGLTGYMKYSYNQMVDYAPDWMIGLNGYTNPLIYYGSRVEAAAMGRAGDSEYINTLVMNNSRAYLHGYVDGVWDYTLGGIESGIESYFNERLEMKEYVRDTFSGKNDEPWFMQARKMGAIGIQYTTGLPTYSMVGLQEDANRMVVDTAHTVTQMNMQDWINLGFAPAKLVYDKGVYFYHCLQSEEAMEGLYYGGGYVAGTTTGIAVDAIVGDVAASKAMSLGQRAIGKLSKINLRGVGVLDDVADTSRIADRSMDAIEGGSVPKTRLETGGRNLDELSVDEILALDDEAAGIYETIRNSSDDVARISSQTGIPEWKIQKIKDHVFNNDHILRDRVGTFDPDIEIADAWERLMNGNYNQNDLDLLNHEYYEHRFEEFFGTDYGTAHNRTVETGRVWDPYKEVD